jgi:uncharacterized protein
VSVTQPLGWHWEWVRPEPLEFHRLQRTLPRYRWWRPLLTVGLATVLYVVFTIIVFAVLGAVIALRTSTTGLLAWADALTTMQVTDPMTLAVLLGSVILMAPAVLLAMLITGMRPWRHVLSVEFRLRRRWLLWCLWPAVAVFVGTQALFTAFDAVGALVAGDVAVTTSATTASGWVGWPVYGVSVVVILLLVPLQAATEEFVFRGLLLQTMGGWVRPAWVAAIPSIVLFTMGHGYGWWGQASIIVFAITTVVLAVRTGGLEAGIALHVVNNLISFLVSATGLTGDDTVSGGADSPVLLFQELVLCGAYLWWVCAAAARRRLPNRYNPAAAPVPVWDATPVATSAPEELR